VLNCRPNYYKPRTSEDSERLNAFKTISVANQYDFPGLHVFDRTVTETHCRLATKLQISGRDLSESNYWRVKKKLRGYKGIKRDWKEANRLLETKGRKVGI
jgi:hypothetical protein